MIARYLVVLLLIFGANKSQAQGSIIKEGSASLLDSFIAAAKANYPRVKAFRSRVNIAEQNVTKAKLDWFNIVSFTYLYNPANSTTLINPNLLLNGYQFGVSTSIGNILQRPGEVRNAREMLEIARYEQDEYYVNLEAIVKQRFYLYLQYSEMLKWRTKSVEGAESAVKESKYKFEKGQETFDNYNKALAVYSSNLQLKIEAEGAYLLARTNLEEIVGLKLESIK